MVLIIHTEFLIRPVMSEIQNYSPLLDLVAEIVSAHVSNNQTDPAVIPVLIKDVFQALKTADQPQSEPEKTAASRPRQTVSLP
jgi:predicted transcriptional regulator